MRRAPRWIVVVTMALGVVAAVAVAASPEERTFAAVSGAVQSLMSVPAPFVGVLLMHALGRPAERRPLVAAYATALLVALAVGAFGIAVSAAAIVLTDAPGDPWRHASAIAAGSLLVQCLAQAVGTGLGLLVRRPVVACLLTIAAPLGLWAALTPLPTAQAWLTPFATVPDHLAGTMTPVRWAQWVVVAALWGLALNLVAARRATAFRGARTYR